MPYSTKTYPCSLRKQAMACAISVSVCLFRASWSARPGTYYLHALWLVGVSLILAGITSTRTRLRYVQGDNVQFDKYQYKYVIALCYPFKMAIRVPGSPSPEFKIFYAQFN